MASLFSFVILSLCLLLSSPFLSNANANANANPNTKLAFTAELIHRDSPISPLFNPHETPSQRLKNAIHRSANRVVRFTAKDTSLNSPQTEITQSGSEYLMNVSLGTPPIPIMAIADTGSDLIWTQCKPCKHCYTQDAPLFDPKASSTYKNVSCSSRKCTNIQRQASCTSKHNKCSYSLTYADHSYTKGNIATDTLTLGSTNNLPVELKNVIIGCGHKNNGLFNKKYSGIIGLGGGAVSLISQLGDSIEGKFSYCLIPYSRNDLSSKINFGNNAIVSGPGTVSTPLIKKYPDTFYYLTLESISVGSKHLKYPGSDSGNCKGNIFIDSGTFLTYLPTTFYSKLEDAVASLINAKSKQDPVSGFSPCYNVTEDIKLPAITMHFNGADVKLNDFNAFIRVSKELFCFAFQPSKSSSLAVYGNLSQMNFLIGYDTVSKNLSFKPAECAKM